MPLLVDLFFVLFISLGNLGLATIILLQNVKKPLNQIFALLSISITIWIVGAFLSDIPQLSHYSLFLNRFILVAVLLVMFVSALLPFYFPKEKKLHKSILLTSIVSVIATSIMTVATPLTISRIEFKDWGSEPIYGLGYWIFCIVTAVYLLASVVLFAKNYRRSKGLERLQMNYLFFGLSLFLLINLFVHTVLTTVLGTFEFYKFGNYSAIFLVVALGIAMIKHRLFDIRFVIARSFAYVLLIISLGFLYALTFISLGKNVFSVTYGSEELLFSAITVLLLSFIFQPLLKFFDKLTSRVFYRDRYISEDFLNLLGSILSSTFSLEILSKKMFNIITTTLKADNAVLCIVENGKVSDVYSHKPSSIDLDTIGLNAFIRKSKIFVFDELLENSQKEYMRKNEIGYIINLNNKNDQVGLLLLGNKLNGAAYTKQDHDVLEVMQKQISIAVNNIRAYEQINKFNVTLREKIKAATTDLKKANRNLRHLDKLKDEFVYIATHELKNPVTAMKGYLSLINENMYGEVPKRLKDPLEQINYSNQQLVTLVNDLLQIARSEAKSITINTEEVDLCSTVEASIGSLKPLADQKKLKLVHHCPKKEPLVKADPDKLKEIFNNLISNAIKYSDKGTIEVSHIIEADMVITHVKDQGFGIAEEDQKKLFSRFYRVEEQAAKGIPGTGLGLFIVKQLIEKMRGRIWFTSKVGTGTTFSFSLPKN